MIVPLRVVLFFFLLIPAGLMAQATYTLEGRVTDEQGEPLTGATVYLHETFQGTLSNDSGYFFLTSVRLGTYHLHITYVGYHAISMDVRVDDSTRFLEIRMEASNLELHEAVIEGDALKMDKSEYSVQVLVLGKDQLMKNQGPTLSNALEQIPGINTINMGVAVSKPVIRGLSGNRIVVAENGIRQEGQQWGGDHGLEIDPFNAEKVEIIKGPASLLFGTDGMGGVIHLKQPLIPVNRTHEVGAMAVYRSVNSTWGNSLSAKGNQNGWIYRARFTYLNYGDYRIPADSFNYNRYVLPVYDQRLKNTAGREQHGSLQLGLHRNWGYSRLSVSSFNQQIGVFSGAIGIPREYSLQPDGNTRNIDLPNQSIQHWKVVSNSNVRFGKNWLESDIGYQYNKRKESSFPHAHGQGPVSGTLAHGLNLQTLSGNFRFFIPDGKNQHAFGLSGQLQHHRFEGFEFLLPQFETVQAGAYYFIKRRQNTRLVLNGGLRADLAAYHIHRHVQPVYQNGVIIGETERVAENNRQFANWSAMLGLSYDLRSDLNFKLNLGKSFRFPTPQELSVNGIHHGSFRHELGDPALDPESSYQLDMSLSLEKKNLYVALSPFLNLFENYIFLRPTAEFSPLPEGGQLFRYEQAQALLGGGELSMEYHPVRSLHLESGLEYVYGWNRSTDLPLPFMPPFQLKSGVEWEWDKLGRLEEAYLKLNWVAAASQNRTDRNERSTPGYHLFHFGAGWTLPLGRHRIQCNLNMRNLFNTPYFNHLSRWRYLNLPEPGRNISLSLAYRY